MSSPRHGPCSCDIPERVARKDRAGEILPDLSGCLRKCAQNSGHYPHGGLGGALPGIFLRQKLPDTATILLAAENHMKTGPFPAGKRARSFGVFFV